MAKTRIPVETEAYTITLPKDVIEMVESLVGGLYGSSRAEVTRTLVADQLKHLRNQGVLKKPI